MRIAFFGSSLVSAYWNGAATYYRGMIHALAELGHEITFYEPDAYQRQQHRDIADPPWAKVVVYQADLSTTLQKVEQARDADLVIKASGVGVFDEALEGAVLELRNSGRMVCFWDVDAPATLERVQQNSADPFRTLIPKYDAIFTYGGGNPVVSAYRALGARECIPVYNGLDPNTHFPVKPDSRFCGDLGFLGNRLPDRECRVEEFFLKPAETLSLSRFLLGGAGWNDKSKPQNVTYFDHVYTCDHNAFNSTSKAVLNVSRDSMARYGFSPATRVFEAAGAAACLITDKWEGISLFFEPGVEILVADCAAEVIEHLQKLTSERAEAIGRAAYLRALAAHTYAHRAAFVDHVLQGRQISAEKSL